MAASAWKVFKEAKKNLGLGNFNFSTHAFRMTLHKAAAALSANEDGLSVYASVGNELADGNGYSTSGKAISDNTWSVTNTTEYEFDFKPSGVFWSANGGNLTSITYGVIWSNQGATKYLVCWSKLSTSAITVNDGSRLTVKPNANDGVFRLS